MKAFNSIGPGPDSDFIRVTTSEGGKKKKTFRIISSSLGLCGDHRSEHKITVFSAGRAAAERPVFSVDGGIAAHELGPATRAEPSRHDSGLQNTLQKNESHIR